MWYRRPSHNHLSAEPGRGKCDNAEIYFPGINLHLLYEWWCYVDEGQTIESVEVAMAVQYAVAYAFLKNANDFKTNEMAMEYLINGIEAESDGICGEKGIDSGTQQAIYAAAYNGLIQMFKGGSISGGSSMQSSWSSTHTSPGHYW